MSEMPPDETLYQGRFLRVVKRDRWEYVTRSNAIGVVAVVAMHEDGRVVLVEQVRVPVDSSVVELPAGLVGDTANDETLLEAAQRELLEETGYIAREWRRLGAAATSPGLTDETITFFLAEGLSKQDSGGGVDGEAIRVHEVPWGDLARWLMADRVKRTRIDMKLLAGLQLARQMIDGREQ